MHNKSLTFKGRKMRASSMAAFTLIEMLVVIAIIALLSSLLVPAVNRALMGAKQVKGLSNLRQVGIAVQLFSMDFEGRFPPSVSKTTNYAVILSPYLGGEGSTYQDGGEASQVFKDPAASSQKGNYHFSCNPAFMPDIQQWDSTDPQPSDTARLIWRDLATRASEQVLMADGAQVLNGDSMATFYAASGVWKRYPHGDSDMPVSRGPDEDDTAAARGQLRWRAANGKGIKCLFADGHVGIKMEGELLQRNLQIDI
ncbi:type II secretion system protein [Kiritimatiellota bacterium B12222]|nr:type II secretion system protein [Kiritimatiellota bacterium B12222]